MRKIEDRSSKTKFPLRKVSHEERVELGRKIASQIINSYKDAVLAICIYGSVAKKLDRPYSDLEIFCVVNDNLAAEQVLRLRWATSGDRLFSRVKVSRRSSEERPGLAPRG